MRQSFDALTPMTSKAVLDAALKEIEEERRGIQLGLKTRWGKLNVALMKYLRFGNIYTISGASGAAKSFLLNMLRTDCTDQVPIELLNPPASILPQLAQYSEFKNYGGRWIRPALNPDLPFRPLFLHFSFEMHPRRELIRTAATMYGTNYGYILSSSAFKKEDQTYGFNKLTGDEQYVLNAIMKGFSERTNLLTFNSTGNLDQLEETVGLVARKYIQTVDGLPYKIIVGIDHTLLTNKLTEKDDLELQNAVIKRAIVIRDKYDAMVFLLSQLNSNIEDDKRRSTPALHYPTKKDLYMGGQLYQGSDFVFTMFMPAKLGIGLYGPNEYPTKNLIHLSAIKSRYDTDGQIWLIENLKHGRIQTAEYQKDARQWKLLPNL